MIYWIAASVVWVVFRIVFRIRVVGRDKIRGLHSYVLCPNHVSAADPVFIVISRLAESKMTVMAKEELFEIHPFISWFFRSVGVIPVHRGKGDTSAVDQCIQKVRSGGGALIFPEGTRSLTGQPGKIKSGAFVVAAAANASLVPCRILYAEGHPRLFRRVTVVFGDPMPCSQLGREAEGRSAAGLRRAKAWLAGEWEKLYLANTTPAQQEKDRQRAQQALEQAGETGKEPAHGDH